MRTRKDLFNNVEMLCQVANCSFPRIFTLELYTTICCLYLNSLSYTSEDGRIHTTLPSRPAHSSRLVGVFDFSGLWLLCAWLCSPHPQLGEIRYHSWGSWYMEERLVPYILSVVWELVSVTHSNACWQYDSYQRKCCAKWPLSLADTWSLSARWWTLRMILRPSLSGTSSQGIRREASIVKAQPTGPSSSE